MTAAQSLQGVQLRDSPIGPRTGMRLGLAATHDVELCASAGFEYQLVDGEQGLDVMRRDESTPLTSAIERRRNRAAKQAGDHHFLLNPGKVLG